MGAKRLVVLALAVRSSRVGYVLLIDGTATDWRLSRTASHDGRAAVAHLKAWVGRFNPNAIVLEDHRSTCRKSRKTRSILQSLHRAAKRSPACVAALSREQHYPNKFSEARDLAERFPELAAWVPERPKLWEREPRNLVYFEALALAVQSGFLPQKED